MKAFVKLIVIEAKFFLRDPSAWIFTVMLPAGILLALGMIPGLRTPDPTFGGLRFIDLFVPSLAVITLATLGTNMLPIRLTSYREKGVLRRLSTTPVHPGALLGAQLVVNMVAAIIGVGVLIGVGHVAFAIPLPQHMLGFVAALLLGTTALFALGLLVAAVAPTARIGAALATILFVLIMFLGGVYLPRFFMPEIVQQIGAFIPPGVQALQDTWFGIAPQPLQLVGMGMITGIAGSVAARLFRWQ